MRLALLSLIAASAPYVFADVKVTSPASGTVLSPGTMKIQWTDSGSAPSLSDLSSYVINLCAGGSTKGTYDCSLATLTSGGTFAAGKAASGDVAAGAGANSKNGYFLQFVSTATAGGQVLNYSPRFGLSGMSGVFSPTVKQGLGSVSATDTEGPPTANDASAGDQDSVQTGLYGVPFASQTGMIRYAPMQIQPPTSITATNMAPLNPTSQVQLAKTYLSMPSATSTQTQMGTHSAHSRANPASPAPMPQDDMQKFLNRWKD